MKRVYCLYRVSTKKQVDVEKDDIPMQKIACQEFCNKQGWVIIKEFAEKGVSGFKVSANDRDAIQDLKAAALNKEFDVLLVYMFDRLGRRDDETPFVVEWFTKQGVQVWSTQEGEQRFDNQVDKLMNYIRFWQASTESAKTSIRIKTRMQQLVESGTYTGGVVPFGYQLVKLGRLNKKGIEVCDLAVHKEEAEIIKEIFNKTVRDGYGSHRLASYLNDLNIRSHNGAKLQCNTIIRILKNPIYTGYIITKNAKSPFIKDLQIVEQIIFDRAQEILTKRAIKDSKKRNIALRTCGQALLSGLLYCSCCGGKLVVRSHNTSYTKANGDVSEYKSITYYCYHKTRKLNDCTTKPSYDAFLVDNTVTAIIKDVFNRIKDAPEEKVIERKIKKYTDSLKSKKRKCENEVTKAKGKLSNLQLEIANSLTGESLYSPEDLSAAIQTSKKQIHDYENELIVIEQDLKSQEGYTEKIVATYQQFVSWSEEFDNATNEQKKMIISALIDRIEIGGEYEIKITMNVTYQQFCYDWGLMDEGTA